MFTKKNSKESRNYYFLGFLIGFLGGILGLDRFYRNQIIIGVLKLISVSVSVSFLYTDYWWLCFIGPFWWLFDNIIWAYKTGKQAESIMEQSLKMN